MTIKSHLLVFLLLLSVVACKKKTMNQAEANITSGTWKITTFSDQGEDETSEFSDANFVFKSDGTVTISGTTTVLGTWNIAKENDSNDDDLFDDKCIEVSLNFPIPYSDLSNDWELESQSSTKITLLDDSDSPVDHLIFEKQ